MPSLCRVKVCCTMSYLPATVIQYIPDDQNAIQYILVGQHNLPPKYGGICRSGSKKMSNFDNNLWRQNISSKCYISEQSLSFTPTSVARWLIETESKYRLRHFYVIRNTIPKAFKIMPTELMAQKAVR